MYDIDKLPNGSDYSPPERIVSACNRYSYKEFDDAPVEVTGVRHGDFLMCNHIDDLFYAGVDVSKMEEEQGFITSKYRFVDRQEAWKISVAQQQIVRRVGGDTSQGGTLYSENLY